MFDNEWGCREKIIITIICILFMIFSLKKKPLKMLLAIVKEFPIKNISVYFCLILPKGILCKLKREASTHNLTSLSKSTLPWK